MHQKHLKFSIIIPCYHDEGKLVHLLAQLRQLSPAATEIIVVDAANNEQCVEICNRFQAIHITDEINRGRQLLAGAEKAQGDVLWFLHADAQLTDKAFTAITAAIASGALGGYFRFRFAAPLAWPSSLLEYAIALRCRLGGIPYGDQGIFMLRSIYQQCGGHAPWPLFEEVSLVRAARRVGNFLPLIEPIYVDSRRWQRDGWWHRTWKNRILALRFICGASPDVLAKQYRSKNRI